jgi:HAD superfamily hydrolase (TIGR01549 family)
MVKNDRSPAVLFDLEDTLIQTLWTDRQHVIEFRRKTREKLIELGIPSSVLEGIERATIMRNKAIEYIEKNLPKADADKIHKEMEKFLIRYELDSARKSKLFPETISTLEKLRKLGIKMGLVTNTSMNAVETVFQLHDLRRYFDVVITREKTKKLKPDPEGILLALRNLGVKSFFMVGDLVHDVSAAKSANGTSILVKRSLEETDCEADYVVQSLSEVLKIVKAGKRKPHDFCTESCCKKQATSN